MEDTLKRLLAAETHASQIATEAERKAEELVRATHQEIARQEQLFHERIPELRNSYLDKAGQRADQSVKELERRYDERLTQLRSLAEKNEESALEAAFNYLLQPAERPEQ